MTEPDLLMSKLPTQQWIVIAADFSLDEMLPENVVIVGLLIKILNLVWNAASFKTVSSLLSLPNSYHFLLFFQNLKECYIFV